MRKGRRCSCRPARASPTRSRRRCRRHRTRGDRRAIQRAAARGGRRRRRPRLHALRVRARAVRARAARRALIDTADAVARQTARLAADLRPAPAPGDACRGTLATPRPLRRLEQRRAGPRRLRSALDGPAGCVSRWRAEGAANREQRQPGLARSGIARSRSTWCPTRPMRRRAIRARRPVRRRLEDLQARQRGLGAPST
jgi:hypothetical protein